MSAMLRKPAPYMVQQDNYPIKQSAAWLRESFKPLMTKRLPMVLYGGFKHGFITQYIQRHKKKYPYYVKVDIEKFYPSLSHHHLTVEAQMAYKRLLGLPYVPKGFKQKFLPAAMAFFSSLPLQEQGIPLNSSFSKALAPLIYVPFFLSLKEWENCKFIVFADDIFIMSKSLHDSRKVYQEVFNFLKSVELQPNLSKVQQGRFVSGAVSFCGYSFAGGYVGIDEEKLTAFKTKIKNTVTKMGTKKGLCVEPRAFIKRMNRQVSGFGHYYKCGQVNHTFAKLDSYVRANVRAWFKMVGRRMPSNKELEALGLFNLCDLLKDKKQKIIPLKRYQLALQSEIKRIAPRNQPWTTIGAQLEVFGNQNKEIIEQLLKIAKLLQ